ncbi:hypothetical protein Q2T40_14755 [Winogradskyella maritima]|uniref:Uncharacterized protein n=1 Tax=Winogradskyella maritima TaxID=1517766 RepID=A0ABV8AH51_9FLAO|nr:hypothetical protein [Winogradskyella maritima]
MTKKLKIILLLSYALIMLQGQIIGMPLIAWLVLVSFDFGNPDQIFVLLGVVGFILLTTKYSKLRKVILLGFVLMAMPIFKRITSVPLEQFNYWTFYIPLLIFVISSLLLLIFQSNKNED